MSENKPQKCPFRWIDTKDGREFKDCLMDQCQGYEKPYIGLGGKPSEGFCQLKYKRDGMTSKGLR